MIKSKNFIKKSLVLKNNITLSFYKCKEDGNNKENNGNKRDNKIKENIKNYKKKLDKNKDNGELAKNISKDKLIKWSGKIKNFNLL